MVLLGSWQDKQNMTNRILHDVPRVELSESFISKLHFSISKGLPHAEPVSTFQTEEHELVIGVLHILQGFSSPSFYWDENEGFRVKDGIYVPHLSQTSLSGILNPFLFAGTCLKQVEFFVKKVQTSKQSAPTLKAFANSINLWLKRLRDVALKEEVNSASSNTAMTTTLLGLTNSLSSLCSGAEHLIQVVRGAVPSTYYDVKISVPASEMAVHILNHLFKKLNEVCLVQGGEEEPYHMLLAVFMESLLPYLEVLDSWLYDGTLDDPCEEMFFYANGAVAIDQPAFWEKSYLLRKKNENESPVKIKRETNYQESINLSKSARTRDQDDIDAVVCPLFLKEIAKPIISAGKSLQLIRHVQDEYLALFNRGKHRKPYEFRTLDGFNLDFRPSNHQLQVDVEPEILTYPELDDAASKSDHSSENSIVHVHQRNHSRLMGVLTLPEVFLVSLVGLVGDGDHIYEYFTMSTPEIAQICKALLDKQEMEKGIGGNVQNLGGHEKIWLKFLANVISERRQKDINTDVCLKGTIVDLKSSVDMEENFHSAKWRDDETIDAFGSAPVCSFSRGNPVITVCRELLEKNMACWNELNISGKFHLSPLNDEYLREAVFGEKCSNATVSGDQETLPRLGGTDYTFGFQFNELEHLRLEDDTKTLETLYAFPTLLPSLQEDIHMSELLPSQKSSTISSTALTWIQSIKPKDTSQPSVIIQECLAVYVKKQVDHIGKHILLKLMSDWKLMNELGVLRAIYLLGSGDLLQQFLTVIFNKLDRGDSWDDDFELNTMLQESIRNSADGTLLSTPDSLVVSVTKHNSFEDEENANGHVSTPRKVKNQCFGIDALDMLKFTYKVSWPLDLIANIEALKKYNQVMGFLLKVKRAKFVLDKARKWMWKGRGGKTPSHKRHLLVEQKLLHFVDAFHQYVMDRVFHSAWTELCSDMSSAGSLDEVIEVHEAYLLSIQRQCFVAPDKLWALIASRIKTVLGLALDFYAVQQTLNSGGAAPAIKARCEMEVDRIEKQFDDCIAFLLRILSFKLNVGHFPHLADLVTRINYNYFYMSQSGNLLTVPSFETTAKTGKSSTFRAD